MPHLSSSIDSCKPIDQDALEWLPAHQVDIMSRLPGMVYSLPAPAWRFLKLGGFPVVGFLDPGAASPGWGSPHGGGFCPEACRPDVCKASRYLGFC